MPNSPTVREIAAAAGVSRTTVSFSLRNHPKIPAETRKRIQMIAEKMGYTPDPVVSTLMNQLRISRAKRAVEKIAYLVWWESKSGWKQLPDWNQWFQGARDRAGSLGYDLEAIWANEPGITPARLTRILRTRGIRCLVLAPVAFLYDRPTIGWENFATVALGHTLPYLKINRVAHDHYQGMGLALQTLVARGYRRIGFAVLKEQLKHVGQRWLSSYLVFQQSIPEQDRVPALIELEWSKAAFREWFETCKPEVVISNMTKPLVYLREMRLELPRDVGFVTLDRVGNKIPSAGIDQMPALLGAAAFETALAQLQRHEFGLVAQPKTVLLEGEWQEGDTIPK